MQNKSCFCDYRRTAISTVNKLFRSEAYLPVYLPTCVHLARALTARKCVMGKWHWREA